MTLKFLKELTTNFQKTSSGIKPLQNVEEVCVFPLPNVVLLPGVILPLHIFEDRYKQMTDEAITTSMSVALTLSTLLPDGKRKNNPVCGAGKINIIQYYPDGRKDICVTGLKRLRIIEYVQNDPYLKARASIVPDIPFKDETSEAQCKKELSLLAKRWVFLNPDLHDNLMEYVSIFKSPHQLADFIGFYFLPSPTEKQELLETTQRTKRVEKIMSFLENQIIKLEKQDLRHFIQSSENRILH